ncbi:MAG: flagellar hook-length control protein FliK [Clostridiales bacterium]|nr:flagellar hook-length control protein FliK [Clostridiales bacterium]
MDVDFNLLAYASVQNLCSVEVNGEIVEIGNKDLLFQNILTDLIKNNLETALPLDVQIEDFPQEISVAEQVITSDQNEELVQIPLDITEFVGMEYYGNIVTQNNEVQYDSENSERPNLDMPQVDTKVTFEAKETPKEVVDEVVARVNREAPKAASYEGEHKEDFVVPRKVEVPKGSSKEAIKLDTKIISESNEIPEDIKIDSAKKEVSKVSLEPPQENYQSVADRQVASKESVGIELNTQVRQPPEVYEQIGREIQAKFEQKAPTEFKLQLQPKELGVIDVKLKINNGKLEIDIMAASKKTQLLLTSQVDKLVQNLGLQNVQVESINVNQAAELKNQDQSLLMNFGADFSKNRERNDSNKQVPRYRQANLEINTEESVETITLKNQRLDYRV